MVENDNWIKKIIDIRISNIFGHNNDDLTYVDLFFPKINVLLGTEGCIAMHEGKDPVKVFEGVGLTSEDFLSINSLIKRGVNINEADSSLDTLLEIDKRSDIVLSGYVYKVRNHMVKTGRTNDEIEKFEKDVADFFGNNPVLFMPCEEYEKTIGETEKSVK